MTTFDILVVNPRDRETQIAVYNGYKLLYMISRKHTDEELSVFSSLYDQVGFRKDVVMKELDSNQFGTGELKVVISRGGLIRPVKSGVYRINDALKHDLTHSPVGEDVINIGGLLADAIAHDIPGTIALIADPTVVDEMQDVARITGLPSIKRKSIFHALNQKAVAKMHAESHKKNYEELNLIVAHLGNGTTVGAHCKGKVIDVNQGFEGDGPFSLIRSGSIPVGDVVRLCYKGNKSEEEMLYMLAHCSGVCAHLGTVNIREIQNRIDEGDPKALLVMKSMAYQVAKCIGEMFAVLKGETDAILITGELAHSDFVVHEIMTHVEKIAPTYVYPGDNEIKAMAGNAQRVIRGEIEVQEYTNG